MGGHFSQNMPLLLQPILSGGVIIASAALLARKHLADNRRLRLPTHEDHPQTLEDKAAAAVDHRFLVNGSPIDEAEFWQHVFWHKLAILCFSIAAATCLAVPMILTVAGSSWSLAMALQVTQMGAAVYLCFIAVLYLCTSELKANWAMTQHAVYLTSLNLALPFASACSMVLSPHTRNTLRYFERANLQPWYIAAAVIHFTTLIGIAALPVAPRLYLDHKGLYTRRVDDAIDEGRRDGEGEYTDVLDSANCSCIAYVLFLYSQHTIKLFNTKEMVQLHDLPAIEAKARSQLALVKTAAYHRRTQTKSALRRVFGPYIRPIVLGNLLECVFLFLTYVPYLCLQQILQMMERGERNISVGIALASIAVLAEAIPEMGNTKLWDMHHNTVNDNAKTQVSLLVWFKALQRGTFASVSSDASDETKASHGIGNADVLALISSDADNVPKLSYALRKVMTGPAEILVGGLFVWYVLGISGLWGIASLVLTAPLTTVLAKVKYKHERRRAHHQDVNIARLQELVQAITHIKTTAQEDYWRRMMVETKRQETRQMLWSKLSGAIVTTLHTASPLLITVVAFAHYTLVRGERLTPSLAFTTVAAFNQLRRALLVLPQTLADSLRHIVSLRRVTVFLETPNVQPNAHDGLSMSLKNATITWASGADQDAFRLRKINLDFPVGGLSLIAGRVGGGKSLLLNALLGEVIVEQGSVVFPSSASTRPSECVAYVPQVAWLMSDSIRGNILFGSPFDEERYLDVIDATCLGSDLLELEDGDQTEIGERGKILSGGQKARVSLARAVYSRAPILVLDDVLSAVDASTSECIISRCFQGPLCQGRTLIMVSHAVSSVAPHAAFACVLDDGIVTFTGSGPELLASLSETHNDLPLDNTNTLSSSVSTLVEPEVDVKSRRKINKDLLLRVQASRLVQDETRAVGEALWQLWRDFLALNGSYLFWSIVIGLGAIVAAGPLLQRSTLKSWSDAESCRGSETRCPPFDLLSHLLTYALLCLMAAVSAGTLEVAEAFGSVTVTNHLFGSMLDHVLGAKSRFYVTNTVGAIVQRFSRDLRDVDQCQIFLLDCAQSLANLLIGIAVLGWIGGPPILFLLLIIFALGSRMVGPFRVSAREVRRLSALTGGPVNALLGESVAGATVIRAAGRELLLTNELLGALNALTLTGTAQGTVWRWMQARMAAVRLLVFAFVLYSTVLDPNISAATAGFYVAFSSTVMAQVADLMHYFRTLDTNNVCLERTKDYCELEQEVASEDLRKAPPASWPERGDIVLTGVAARYASGLSAVISDVSFTVHGGERVGVVGATGCGKSTLVKSFFSFVDVIEGDIRIDGQDISQLKLQAVRERITMIGQDPIILSGTLRSNLDPESLYSDAQLYKTLQQVRLIPAEEDNTVPTNGFVNVFKNLDTVVQAGGLNFSVGQKQLLVIARALLRAHRILILDEATSSIDGGTDEAITQVIRENFEGSTVLVIAHRLRTIIDFDNIIVMDKGRVVQTGKPSELIAIEGPFQTLCKAGGDQEYETLCRLAGL